MIIYVRWDWPWMVRPFRWWLLHHWCDHGHWHKGMKWDGMRILGLTYHNYDIGGHDDRQ